MFRRFRQAKFAYAYDFKLKSFFATAPAALKNEAKVVKIDLK